MSDPQIKIETSHQLDKKVEYIKFYWQLKTSRYTEKSLKQLVLPSVHIDLIFIIQGSLKVNESIVNEPFVSPVLLKWKEIELEPGTVLFGIRLNPVYFHFYSGIELSELKQAPNLLKYVLVDSLYYDLNKRVFEDTNFENRIINLNRYFNCHFERHKNLDHSLLRNLKLITEHTDISVNELASINGYSKRWTQKIFKQKVGIAPSKVIQISRFNRFLRILANNSVQQLSEASYEAGYSDQSHLIHDFKKFTTHTPKFYLPKLPKFIEVMNCK